MEVEVGDYRSGLLKDMKQRIVEIERLVLELRELGKGIPVIEKNARIILSVTHVLRFGVADPADILDTQQA